MINEDLWFNRTELLLGKEKTEVLRNSHVLIAGLGGVGGYGAELLCRAGIGKMTLVDHDKVNTTNRNRQIIALKSTEGRYKVEVMAERLRDINPDIELMLIKEFVDFKNIDEILKVRYDYILDAIDTLSPKVSFLDSAVRCGFRVISAIGSAGRVEPALVTVSDISETHDCDFARLIRKRLHKRGIRTGFKVVSSSEYRPLHSIVVTDNSPNKKTTIGTISYMPALFGLLAAAEIIKDLTV